MRDPLLWGVHKTLDDLVEADYLPNELGHRFAGLVDGEGCFFIGAGGPTFIVKMRADDRELLERMRSELGGPGRIWSGAAGTGGSENRKPWVRWEIGRQREVAWLTRVFDAFPLWSKKKLDYAIWREAAIAWAAGTPAHALTSYRVELRAARQYREAA